jgi:nucleoside-diphosphate-sugar epimerase
MNDENLILVTGATGNTGSALLQQLEGRGVRVRAMVRSDKDGARLPRSRRRRLLSRDAGSLLRRGKRLRWHVNKRHAAPDRIPDCGSQLGVRHSRRTRGKSMV